MFIDQKEYKEEWYEGSFNIDTFNDEFFKNIIAIYYSSSSGMGGPGVLRLLSDENIQYEIGMDMFRGDSFYAKVEDGYEFTNVAANIPMLERTDIDAQDEKYRKKYKGELEGWTYKKLKTTGGIFLVRDDYLQIDNNENVSRIMDCEDKTHRIILWPFGRVGRYLMDSGKKPKTYIYEGTRDYRIYLQKQWEEYEAEKERVRIRPEDVQWKPRYSNNQMARFDLSQEDGKGVNYQGEYMLLVRADEEWGVKAEKWTIIPQWKDRHISQDSEIECYILYCKEYDSEGIEGPLRYPKPTSEANDEYKPWWTFRGTDVNNYGRMVFVHKTIEAAKQEALKHANGNLAHGGFNRENLITEYPSKEIEERIIYEKYAPYLLFLDKSQEIIKIINDFVYGPHRGGHGYIINELSSKLGISENMAYHLKNISLYDLDSDSIDFAKQRLSEIGYYNDKQGLIPYKEKIKKV